MVDITHFNYGEAPEGAEAAYEKWLDDMSAEVANQLVEMVQRLQEASGDNAGEALHMMFRLTVREVAAAGRYASDRLYH